MIAPSAALRSGHCCDSNGWSIFNRLDVSILHYTLQGGPDLFLGPRKGVAFWLSFTHFNRRQSINFDIDFKTTIGR